MTPEEHLRAGNVDQAMDALRNAIRGNPSDWKLRVFLFQLLSVNGDWEKALTQLNLVGDMGPDCMLLAQIFRPLLQCEALRADVFAGRRSPLIFGEPQEWVGLLVHANALLASGNGAQARQMMDRALEDAPAVAGRINDQDFEWIADADSRLGPVLEAVVDGKYYWIPFNRIARVTLTKPADLRDLVWISANFTWANGGESPGMVPVRYPGSEKSLDGGIRLSHKTDWRDAGDGFFLGEGQRLFATDSGEHSLLETQSITLNQPPAPAPAAG